MGCLLFVLPQNACANNGHFLVGGLVFSFFSFFFGGLIALRGLACLTYGGGLSLAAAAAAAAPLHFWFRAQAAVQFYSTVLCGAACCSLLQLGMFLSLLLTNAALLSQVAIRVHGPPPKSHQEHDESRKVVRQ